MDEILEQFEIEVWNLIEHASGKVRYWDITRVLLKILIDLFIKTEVEYWGKK